MEEERGLVLCELSNASSQDVQSEDWSGLPPELLEMIGSKLAEGPHLQNAAVVCKSWNANIATGLNSMEVDMHSDPGAWRAKIEKLQSLIRHLRACTIHVNTHISADMLVNNIALVQQLRGVSELSLHLREGCDLPPAAAAAIAALPHLTTLSIIGGNLSREAAATLLSGLAAAAAAASGCAAPLAAGAGSSSGGSSSGGSSSGGSPGDPFAGLAGCGLRSLTLIPSVPYGLGDEEMAALAGCSTLEVLEFRACRLTNAGLATLSLGLPRLTRLSITSLDSDSGYELACLERLSALAELDLALDQAPTGAASRRALCAVRPGRSLSLSFRWTERAQGLLTEYGNQLANLTHLDVGACRVGSESLFEAVAQLTGLRELRMAVYSNADHCIPCHLSRLSALGALQRFHLEKRRAYFPESRRFGESSIAVPVTPEGLRALAGRWLRLRSLRLALSRKDYSPEALTMLSSFTGLRELGIVVERYPGGAGPANANTTAPHNQQQEPQAAEPSAGFYGSSPGACGGIGLCRLSHRRAADLPPLLDLAYLPPGLHSLELNNLLLDLSEEDEPSRDPSQQQAAAAAAAAVLPPAAATGLAPPGYGFDPAIPVPVPAAPSTSLGLAPGLGLGLAGAAAFMPPVAVFFPPDPAFVAEEEEAATPLPPPSFPSPLHASSLSRSLSQLGSLDIEGCVVRPPLLARVAARCGTRLRCLRLVGVVGLSDAALAESLGALSGLRALTVSALGNRAVTQAGLAALSASGCRPPLLRQLTWESDDLTARGPHLPALAPLTSLRHLYLSCTHKTAELALGSLRVLQDALPYCHVDMVWTNNHPGGI